MTKGGLTMNKAFLLGCRIYVGVMAVILLINGFLWGFLPDSNLALNGIIVESVLGMNMIKSDIGGSLIAISILTVLFLLNRKQWFYPVIIFTSSLLFVRIISLLTDGYHEIAIAGVVMEVLFLLSAISINYKQNNT